MTALPRTPLPGVYTDVDLPLIDRIANLLSSYGYSNARVTARTILRELREPTAGMVEYGALHMRYEPGSIEGNNVARACWRAMIDAALKEADRDRR